MQAIDEPAEKKTDKDEAFKVTEIDSKKRAQTTTPAANEKYMKMAEFYKKKYAGNFVYDPAAAAKEGGDKKAEIRRRSVDEDDEEDEEEVSAEEDAKDDEETTASKSHKQNNNSQFELKGVNSTKYKEEYRQAGKEFAASLKNLTLELLDELFDGRE